MAIFSFFDIYNEIRHSEKNHSKLYTSAERLVDYFSNKTENTKGTFSSFNMSIFSDLTTLAMDVLKSFSDEEIANADKCNGHYELHLKMSDLNEYGDQYSGLALVNAADGVKVGNCDQITLVFDHNAHDYTKLHLVTMYPSMSKEASSNLQFPNNDVYKIIEKAIKNSYYESSTKTWLHNYLLEDRDFNLISKRELSSSLSKKVRWNNSSNKICSYRFDDKNIVIGNEVDYYLLTYQSNQWNIYSSKNMSHMISGNSDLEAYQGMGEILQQQTRLYKSTEFKYIDKYDELSDHYLQEASDSKLAELSM